MARYVEEDYLSVEEAVSYIENGMRVALAPGCGEPRKLIAELARQAERFDKLEVVGGIACGELPILAPGMEKHFKYITWHVSPGTRAAVARGAALYAPLRYSDIIRALSPDGPLKADVLLCTVSPGDDYGYVSLGPSVSYTKSLIETATLILAEQNARAPFTLGDSLVERHKINGLIYSDEPLAQYPTPMVSQVEKDIARHVGDLIPDGATIQIGVGSVPEAVIGILPEKRDLALHSLLTDNMIALIQRGIVTARKKSVRPGKCDIGELMGTERIMKFAERNPMINMMPATETHDPRKIAEIDNFIAINSALQIDLSGQVDSEGFGDDVVAAIGGQFDFVLGAQFSEGGKSIFALPSTGGPGGKASRIVPRFTAGTPISTPRHMVHYVVTEYGVADLREKTLEQRAKEMIRIAHPSFREPLMHALKHKPS